MFCTTLQDLYLIHSPKPGPELRAESWKALETLVEQGKVKSIGKPTDHVILLTLWPLFGCTR